MTRPIRWWTAVTVLGVCACITGTSTLAQPANGESDRVVLQFSTVGDSRQDLVHADETVKPLSVQDRIWLQNTKAWSRIMRGIEAQNSRLLFFNGDMIMGQGLAGPTPGTSVDDVVHSDLMAFYRQYGFWRGMVATLMESGTYVVPVPGNHELQSTRMGKKSQVENEDAWRANMGDLIIDTERFARIVGQPAQHVSVDNHGAQDDLRSDQSQLSYSFDVNDSHFAIINTDPFGRDNTAPVRWLEHDLRLAQERGAHHLFVFGHKQAFTYQFGLGDTPHPAFSGLDTTPQEREAFWHVIEAFHATYFCGHEHQFNMSQPRGGAWQILVGSGGSPWSAKPGVPTRNPDMDRSYAWATVRVYASGAVDIDGYGFNDQFGPTRHIGHVALPH